MTTPAIRDATLCITGANRGLGRAFARGSFPTRKGRSPR